MKLSLPVSRVIRLRQPLEQAGRVDEPARVERRFLDRDHPIDPSHRLEDVGLVVHPRQRGLQLEQDERQPDLGDRRVVRDGDTRIEGLAQVGRDREDE